MSGAAGGDDVEVRLSEEERRSVLAGIYEDATEKTVTGGYFHTFAAIEALLADRLRAERAEGAREALEEADAIADQRDQAELDAMQAKAEAAEWVNAYDRELVRRKAAEARAAAHATQETSGEGA